jgi:dTDP-4-dehydrorhamnose reductase
MKTIRALTLNAILPHRLANLCKLIGARLIHISSDCVFSGKSGDYGEDDRPDAIDLYGSSKRFGEISGPNLVTLRTSTIGHEISTRFGLLEWFLGQKTCVGYSNAIFSGLPTIEFSRIVRDLVIPNESLHGIYHVAARPINKFELLSLIAQTYQKEIKITKDVSFVIDRSLNAARFRLATGYEAPAWPELIKTMHSYK